MRKCSSLGLNHGVREEGWATVSQMSDQSIHKVARETPVLYYRWCVEAYAARRKAEAELEFHEALLEKLCRCDPQMQSVT